MDVASGDRLEYWISLKLVFSEAALLKKTNLKNLICKRSTEWGWKQTLAIAPRWDRKLTS
jgi:hypothetical protein